MSGRVNGHVHEGSADKKLEALLDFLKRNRGFDFSGYKVTSLTRRITRRMHEVGVADCVDYVDYLEVHPDEFLHLFDTILINVTSFFRDPQVWEYLGEHVLPQIVLRNPGAAPIRVWCPGCATGEEPYSMAMLLAEHLGMEQYQARVKIYATDVDEPALETARSAGYGRRRLESIPPTLVDRYFRKQSHDRFVIVPELRRAVIFGRHDLVQDAPISRLDLLMCRNVLMYFNAETQGRIVARFHHALNEQGVLVVGKAEMLLTQNNLFDPINPSFHTYVKVSSPELRDNFHVLGERVPAGTEGRSAAHLRLQEGAFDAGPTPQVVVDLDGRVALANDMARRDFGLGRDDIGRLIHDLAIFHRPVSLRPLLDQAYSERRPIMLEGVEWSSSAGKRRYTDIRVTPLQNWDNALLGASICYQDVTRYRETLMRLDRAEREWQSSEGDANACSEGGRRDE